MFEKEMSKVSLHQQYYLWTYLLCYEKHYSQNAILLQMQLAGVDLWRYSVRNPKHLKQRAA